MGDGTERTRVHEEVEVNGGLYKFAIDGFPDCAFIETHNWGFTQSGEPGWEFDRIYELTTAELDALIDALTRARALRGNPASGIDGSAGDE